jgi:predicted transcriptional regulator
MNKTQQKVIEEVIRKLERGPASLTRNGQITEQEYRVWSESWLVGPLRAVLENAAGRMSASELSGTA